MSLQYIIDGYNIINHPLFIRAHKHIASPAAALSTFIRIKRLTGSPKNKVTVVFDGYPESGITKQQDTQINLVYSRRESADEKIKRMVEESADRKNTIVVSDDREIKFIVKSLGAHPIGIEEFVKAKEKSPVLKEKDNLKPELTYSQMHKITQELRKIWLDNQ